MDDLVITVITTYFSIEAQEELFRSFGIFGLFNHGDGLEAFDEICNMAGTYSSDTIIDTFYSILNKHLNILLEHHTLQLVDEATLYEKNEILSGLYTLQYLEDYEPISRILEGTISDEEMLSACLHEVCELDESHIVTLIHSMRPTAIAVLKEFINAKEGLLVEHQENNELIRDGLHALIKVYQFSDFEQAILHSDLLIGVAFKNYLPIFHEELFLPDDIDESAKRILFMITLSSDGIKNPLKVFGDHIPTVCTNPTSLNLVKQRFAEYLGRFNEYKTVSNQV